MLCHRRCDRWPGAGSPPRFLPDNHPGEISPGPPGSGGTVFSAHSPAHGLWLNWSPGQHPAVESSQKTVSEQAERSTESSSSSGLGKVFQQEAAGRFLLEYQPLPALPKVTCNLELDSCLGRTIKTPSTTHQTPSHTNKHQQNFQELATN